MWTSESYVSLRECPHTVPHCKKWGTRQTVRVHQQMRDLWHEMISPIKWSDTVLSGNWSTRSSTSSAGSDWWRSRNLSHPLPVSSEDKPPSLSSVCASNRLVWRDVVCVCVFGFFCSAACGADAARSWARKSPSGVRRPIRALITLQHPASRRRTCSPLSLDPHTLPPAWQEDGTVHSASCTRTEGVTHRLAAGLLNSSCRLTWASCFYFCAWSWSGSAGNTKVGKSGGPRRRRRTSQARKYCKPFFLLFVLNWDVDRRKMWYYTHPAGAKGQSLAFICGGFLWELTTVQQSSWHQTAASHVWPGGSFADFLSSCSRTLRMSTFACDVRMSKSCFYRVPIETEITNTSLHTVRTRTGPSAGGASAKKSHPCWCCVRGTKVPD